MIERTSPVDRTNHYRSPGSKKKEIKTNKYDKEKDVLGGQSISLVWIVITRDSSGQIIKHKSFNNNYKKALQYTAKHFERERVNGNTITMTQGYIPLGNSYRV